VVTGVAAPSAHEAEHGERPDARRDRSAIEPNDVFGRYGRLRPASSIQFEPSAISEQVVAIEVDPVLRAVLDRRIQVQDIVTSLLHGPARQVRERSPDVVGKRSAAGKLECFYQPVALIGVADTDRDRRVERDLGVAEPFGELEGAVTGADRLVGEAVIHAACGNVGVGHRELASRRETLEQHGRLAGSPKGFLVPARADQDVGEPGERHTFFETLSELTAARERLLDRLDRSVVPVGDIALSRAALEQLGPFVQR
jgi:hypothetical protein